MLKKITVMWNFKSPNIPYPSPIPYPITHTHVLRLLSFGEINTSLCTSCSCTTNWQNLEETQQQQYDITLFLLVLLGLTFTLHVPDSATTIRTQVNDFIILALLLIKIHSTLFKS